MREGEGTKVLQGRITVAGQSWGCAIRCVRRIMSKTRIEVVYVHARLRCTSPTICHILPVIRTAVLSIVKHHPDVRQLTDHTLACVEWSTWAVLASGSFSLA